MLRIANSLKVRCLFKAGPFYRASRSLNDAKPSANPVVDSQLEATVKPASITTPRTKIVAVDSNIKLVQGGVCRKAASFDEVPGPEVLKRFAKTWSYVPIIGNHVTARTLQYVLSAGKIFGSQLSWGNNMAFFRYLLNEYGPIVRLHGPFGGDVVILSRPEHATAVFESDGPYPVRSSLDCIERYRLHHRKYKNAGPFVMHGPEWEAMRNSIEPALKVSVENQCLRISKTADNFLERLIAIRNQQLEVPKTFHLELQKWSLECLLNITFSKSFGFLDPRGLSSKSDNAVLLNAITEATSAIKRCEFGFHMWKFFDTPAWKKLVLHCDTIDHILGSNLRKAQQQLRDRKEKKIEQDRLEDASLIDYFLLKETMNTDDILTVLLDMTLLGVNMSAYTAGFLMFHLAKNQRVQYNLYNELKELKDDPIKKDSLNNLPYLKACLYESLRLKPPMPILNRVLNKDVTIYGYKIPKGTYVLIATNLSSLREEHFEDPLKFKPERWLGMDKNNTKDMSTLATMPFGHGPKQCLARELAEIEIYYLIIKLLRKFRIEYHYGDINSNNKLLSSPSRPFKFRFVERE